MDSYLNHQHHNQPQKQHHHQQQQQQNMNSGLTRYRSAPSSYFSNLINSSMYEDEDIHPFFNTQVSSPETQRILSRLVSDGGGGGGDNPTSRHNNLGQIRENELRVVDSMKQELTFPSRIQEQQRMMYQNHAQSQEAVHNNINSVVSSSSSTIVNEANAPSTNLLRQSSSPAGFFKHINTEDSSISSANRSKRGMVSSSGSHSSSRPLSRIPENDGKTMAHSNGDYVFSGGSWEESAMLTDGFLKEFGESDPISSSENQVDIGRIHASTGLTHQLSLPTSSTELSLTEKLLQFHDSVPLRSRAKRGCATHPRSIAERVRRTRISERMKRLQDLVPNMDKQTSTADMLDLAVDYIKQLQNHVETLTDRRKRCTCAQNQEL